MNYEAKITEAMAEKVGGMDMRMADRGMRIPQSPVYKERILVAKVVLARVDWEMIEGG